jgi:hypothetical protein
VSGGVWVNGLSEIVLKDLKLLGTCKPCLQNDLQPGFAEFNIQTRRRILNQAMLGNEELT